MTSNNATNTSNPITVGQGCTGDASFTAYSVLCGGTTSTGALQNVSGVGTSGQVLTSNGASALPTWQAAGGGGGGIVQLVSTNTKTQSNTSSSSFVDVTNLTVSITPTSSSHKVYVFATIMAGSVGGNELGYFQLVRGSTAIGIGTSTGSATNCGGGVFMASSNGLVSVSLSFLDSPATTSATTYKVQYLAPSGSSSTVYVNVSALGTTDPANGTSSSTITVMETT